MKSAVKKLLNTTLRKIGLWSVDKQVYVKQYQVACGETLKGKNVLITGGTSGIGLAIAKKCLAEGANVIITGRNGQKLNQVLLSDKTGRLKGMVWDVANLSAAKDMLAEVHSLLGSEINALVNNAGISIREKPGCLTEEVWDEVLRINLTAPIFISQEMAKAWMLNSCDGCILNISSMSGLEPSIDAYSVAKCGLNSMTKGMARIWASQGIRVNSLAVGVTIGTQLRDTQRKYKPTDNLKCDWIPVGRFAVPDEIAETAGFLISDRAAYLTGAVVECDGAGSIAFGS